MYAHLALKTDTQLEVGSEKWFAPRSRNHFRQYVFAVAHIAQNVLELISYEKKWLEAPSL